MEEVEEVKDQAMMTKARNHFQNQGVDTIRGGRGFGQGRGTFRCCNCNELGHPSFKCHKWNEDNKERRVNLTQEDKKEEQEEEIMIPLEEGELLLMGKVQPSQQERIFRTNCKIHGKVCKLIVDSGDCHNLVAYEVVKKLNLQTLAHPNPYFSTWGSEGQNVLVKDQVVINFSIGQYDDSILCDVMDMSCGHLILGRPWQYSRRIIHDGYQNTYVVHKGGRKYKLSPLMGKARDNTVMCFGNEFLVKEKGKKSTDLEHYDSPFHKGLWNLDHVQVGTVKCPIIGQRKDNKLEEMQMPQDRGKGAAMKQISTMSTISLGQPNNKIFVSNDWCMNAGVHRRKQVTFGDYLVPKNQMQASKHEDKAWMTSWDKKTFIHGEYGVGAPRPTKATIQPSEAKKEFNSSINVNMFNYELLSPIMAFEKQNCKMLSFYPEKLSFIVKKM